MVGEVSSETVSLHNPYSCTADYQLSLQFDGPDNCGKRVMLLCCLQKRTTIMPLFELSLCIGYYVRYKLFSRFKVNVGQVITF